MLAQIEFTPLLHPHRMRHKDWTERRKNERGPKNTHLIKHILQLILRQRRALHILDSAQLFRHPLSILPPNRAHLLLIELLAHAGVIAEIGLRADDQAGHAGTVVVHLWEPLFAHVLEGGGRGDGEADEEDVGLGVGEGTQTVVIFLSGGIKEAEGVWLVADPKGKGLEGMFVFVCDCLEWEREMRGRWGGRIAGFSGRGEFGGRT